MPALFLEDPKMIEFSTVSREFRSLVERRRHLFTFLGSVFAALGLFLQNVLKGNLPDSLRSIETHVFAFYAFALMVLSLVLALRMAKLHGGLVLNGILYARLMQEQTFTRPGDPQRAAQHNFFSVSFLQYLLVNLIGAFAAAILALALGLALAPAAVLAILVFVLWLGFYFRFHRQAAAFALQKTFNEPCAPFDRGEWEEHLSASLEQANQGLIAEIGFAGLIVFSVFEALSGLNQISAAHSTGITAADVKRYGPHVYGVLMVVTCLLELVIYLRMRVAVGHFSLQLDPTDRPFRPLRLTDSLLGYMLLAFLFVIALHILLVLIFQPSPDKDPLLWAIDAAVFAVAVLAEQLTLIVAGRRAQQT
jgi:hypothetical protein